MGILRLLLAISVIIYHTTPILGLGMVGGIVAVQAFFIVSGFYMALILNEKYIGYNSSYKLFLTNRFLRIFPAYWVVLFLTLLFWILLFFIKQNGPFTEYWQHFSEMSFFTQAYIFFTNIFIVGQDAGMFLGVDMKTYSLYTLHSYTETPLPFYYFFLVPQAWSIAIELLFYLVCPFIVRKKISFQLIIFSIFIIARLLIYNHGNNFDPWNNRIFPLEISLFILGSLSYQFHVYLKNKIISTNAILTLAVIIYLITISYNLIPIDEELKKWMYYLLLFIALPFLFRLSSQNETDRLLGELSYPVYIVHVLVISVVGIKIPQQYNSIATIFVSLIASYLLYIFVITPIEKIRQNRLK